MTNDGFTAGTCPEWVLTESVGVTLVGLDADRERGTFLITRVVRPADASDGAVVLTFDEGRVLVNGRYLDLGDDMIAYCSLVDDAYPNGPAPDRIGERIATAPYED